MGSCHRDGTFEFLAGDIGLLKAITRHGAELRLRSVENNSG